MVSKYVAIRALKRPKSYYEDVVERQSMTTISVIEEDSSPIETGLLDSSGVPLYRVDEKGPWGFTRNNVG